jgi:hypothetical protein
MPLMVTPVLHIPYCHGNFEMVNKISLNGYYENTAHITSLYRHCYLFCNLKIDSHFPCLKLTFILIFTCRPQELEKLLLLEPTFSSTFRDKLCQAAVVKAERLFQVLCAI